MPRTVSHLRAGPAAAAVLLLVSACASRPSLVPAPDAQLASPGGTIALASEAGVTMRVDPDAWGGRVDIEQAVTPLHVQIENDSGRKLRVRYGDFSLVSESGTRYVALPPYDIHATVAGPAPAYRYPPLDRFGFVYDRFYIAPYYRYMYPGLAVWNGPELYFDPFYYRRYYPYWGRMRIELPTPEMLRHALPEGVLEEGGKVAGFLYFERVDPGDVSRGVTFRAEVVDIVSEEKLTTLEVPFVIARED